MEPTYRDWRITRCAAERLDEAAGPSRRLHGATTEDRFARFPHRRTAALRRSRVGVMGKGIALAFKKRLPTMYSDYAARRASGEVKLAHPYIFRSLDKWVRNFPRSRRSSRS